MKVKQSALLFFLPVQSVDLRLLLSYAAQRNDTIRYDIIYFYSILRTLCLLVGDGASLLLLLLLLSFSSSPSSSGTKYASSPWLNRSHRALKWTEATFKLLVDDDDDDDDGLLVEAVVVVVVVGVRLPNAAAAAAAAALLFMIRQDKTILARIVSMYLFIYLSIYRLIDWLIGLLVDTSFPRSFLIVVDLIWFDLMSCSSWTVLYCMLLLLTRPYCWWMMIFHSFIHLLLGPVQYVQYRCWRHVAIMICSGCVFFAKIIWPRTETKSINRRAVCFTYLVYWVTVVR